MGLLSILSVIPTVTIGSMLNFNGGHGHKRHGLKKRCFLNSPLVHILKHLRTSFVVLDSL